jgi:DNA-binding NarL/FixJ family response regulator
MPTKSDIVIAEDNPRDREFLGNALPDYQITFTTNGRDALEAAKQYKEPWVISDLQMPEMNGIQLATQLWHARPEARIVFWSQHQDEMYVRALAEIIPPETVYGYVLKSNPSDILSKAVDAVFRDCQCWIDPKVRPVQARANKPQSGITDLEYEVLSDIALGLTDNVIAKRRYLSRRGVQSRLKSLYAKLGIDQEQHTSEELGETLNMRTRAVSIALRRGLINKFEIEQEEAKLQQWLSREGLSGQRL